MRRVRTGRLVLGCGLGVLWLGGEAASAASQRPTGSAVSPLSLHVSPCLAKVLDETEVARLVAIELGPGRPSVSTAGSTTSPTRLHAQIDCSDGSAQLADLTVEDRGSGRALVRTVDLSAQAQPLYARLIALSLAELVHAVASERWEAPRPTPSPPPAPVVPPTRKSPTTPIAIPSPESRIATPGGLYVLGGFALLVPLAGPGAPLHVGASLRIGGDHRYHLGWDFDAQVLTARRRTALGDLTSDLLSSRATLQAHLAWSRLLLRGGLGLRVGGARLAGAPGDSASTIAREAWAPFGGPLISLGLAFAPQSLRRLRADLTSEAGYLLWSATARVDGQPSLAIAGPWVGLSLSLGWGQTTPSKQPTADR